MKRKKFTSAVAILLAVLMLMSILLSVLPTAAYAINQSDIDNIQQQRDELSSRVNECRTRIDQLKAEKANVLEQKAALDEQNRCANEQLNLVAEEIALYDDMIEEKEDELAKAKRREEDQLARYRARVRAMEENGGYNILALILNSDNFGDFLTAMDDMGEIMESDKALEKAYIDAREEVEEIKEEYESERAEYEEKQEELRAEQEALEQQIADAYDELDQLEEEIEQAIREYEAAEAAEAAAAATIMSMIAQYNAQKRQEAANNAAAQQPATNSGNSGNAGTSSDNSGNSGGTVNNSGNSGGTVNDGGNSGGAVDNSGSNTDSSSGQTSNTPSGGGTGSLMWPVPCSTRVTSRFGYRSDPYTGEQRFHSGIDIDGFGNDGNAIVAADGGTVITAAYDGGYGNYVIIDHGNYTQTLYAHMSGFAVSYGDYVSQGQTIGYLGSTGRSTGTHCHYEVFVNGSRVDPTSYYGGLSYWNC